MKSIFVDGYNVINSWPNLKEQKDISFEGARQSLIDKLHNYGVFKECRIILVFDAHKVPGSIEKAETINKNISVVFTKESETADAYIERHVNELGRRHEIVVVTSDNLEQQTIFQRGAVRMSSIEFYYEIIKIENTINIKTTKNNINNKNILEDNIADDVVKELEKIRRGR